MIRQIQDTPGTGKAFNTFILLFLVIITGGAGIFADDANPVVELTTEERTWLDQNPEKLTLYFNTVFPPLEFSTDEGSFTGLGADIITLVEERLDVTFIKTAFPDWNLHLAAIESGECAIAPTIVRNTDRERYILFTAPYSIVPVVIIASKTEQYNITLDDLFGRSVAVVSGYATEKYIRDYTGDQLELTLVNNVSDGLRALSFGQVDFFIENLAVSSYYIEQQGISNLRVVGSTDYSFSFSIGVGRKYPLLFSSIEKALDSISETEFETVRNRWISLQVYTGLAPKTLYYIKLISVFTMLLVICLAAISYFLKRKLNEKIFSLNSAQQEIIEQTERLELALEATHASLWDYYPASDNFFISRQWYTIFDYSPGVLNLTLDEWTGRIHPDDRKSVEDGLKKYIDKGENNRFEVEFRMQHSDGSWRWLLGKGRAISWNDDGTISRVVGLNLDIHSRKEAQENLLNSEARFRTLFQMAPMPLVDVSQEGKILELNLRFIQDLGYNLNDIPTQEHWWHAAYPDKEYRKWVISNWGTLKNNSLTGDSEIKPDEYRVTCKDGSIRIMMIDANLIENNILVSFFDITERKKTEEELRHLRNYLSNIINSMPSVLVGVNAEGKITQWNRAAEETTGITSGEALGKILSDVFPGLVSDIKMINESIQTRKIIQEQKIHRRQKGDAFYEDVTIFPLIANGVEGAVIRIDDVTEKIRMEEMMIQSEKMLSIGGLAAGMAHEINNPLAGVMQTAAVLSKRLTDVNMLANKHAADESGIDINNLKVYMKKRGIIRMISTINESGNRVAEIVSNVLSFARKSDAQVSSYNIDELLDKTLELAATDYDFKKHYDFKMVEVKKEFELNVPPVPCEGAKIQQVLLNILRNGAQAMQDAGIDEPVFIIRIKLDKSDNLVRIEIEDNGPGIEPAVLKRVFEPFYTTKPVGIGTGLGLSVSYFIITENHGGEMEVQSVPGLGATFIIRLPLDGKKT